MAGHTAPPRSTSSWQVPLVLCLMSVAVSLLLQAWAGYLSFGPFLLAAPIALSLLYGPAWGCLGAVLAGLGQLLPAVSGKSGPLSPAPSLSIATLVATGCLAAVGAAVLRQTQVAQQEEAKILAAQLRLASVTGDPSSLPALLAAAVWAVPELTGRSVCALFLWDSQRRRFGLAQQSPPPVGGHALPGGLSLEPGRLPALDWAVASHAPAIAERAELASSPYATALDFPAAALIPLVNWGRVLGCLLLADRDSPPQGQPSLPAAPRAPAFTERELELVRGLAGQVAVALENASLYDEILTQKEQLERQNRQLADQKQRLEALERLREDLTHMIVHDLRTPLTSLIGGLQTLTHGGSEALSPEGEEMVSLALSGANTLLGMVNDLLDVGKMEAGQMVLDRSPLDLATVAHAAVDQVRALAREKASRLIEAIAPDLPPMLADDEQVRRVLVNLLGNAIKFTPEQGEVVLEAQPEGGCPQSGRMVRVRVRDTGEGIPAADQERIFEKFGQVESRKGGRKLSTGLGLTFCKLAVEAHGGAIGVESTLMSALTSRCRRKPGRLPVPVWRDRDVGAPGRRRGTAGV